ncbi:Uncharacterised protein [Burkholderia pseudomallei]|uniref:hypothetical protein n=1 Tax=Burkholderia pseudomallei TaxID=28450 RepID=UPI0001722B89|nr:hypothetical protein [Burkholderia pseudomallei]EDS86520.1 conserved hypothetical protein [Burkholderia pseudomallei S13]MBF3439880.1 histidine phosphatase family protein [Burkholderia pseudomallei]MBF3464434.1 histidine phosphatase family protein [Burkholderia pseudomallei]OMS23996.1 histidine phosphatase family protein [Burkholderia pseudomallei]CAJ3840566.1 Uncharacterised protein [Burkholderia pseudomallei]
MKTPKIMIIRHAEKPEHHVVAGVDLQGQPDTKSLTPQGWQRAGALVQFFAPGDDGAPPPPLARPMHLFAAYADPATDDDSKRPYQTLGPLSAYLGPTASIDDSCGKDELQKLVDKVSGLVGTVLIAWEHRRIPSVARLLVEPGVHVPDWPDDRFDVVWVFDRQGSAWQLTQVPQLLLAGDRSTTFA